MQFQEHGSANKFDFSTSRQFGFLGDPFVAETGSFVPITGAVEFTGYRVVRVDHDAADETVFVANVGDTVDEVFNPDSFNKPIDVKFDGDVMMVVDFGVFEPGLNKMQPGIGKVWLVAHGPEALDRFPRAADRIVETGTPDQADNTSGCPPPEEGSTAHSDPDNEGQTPDCPHPNAPSAGDPSSREPRSDEAN